ncbi:M1 family metallopeptidase [Flavobacteriaceae bacterium]|nr:M1 family metallopeptidase [Flavobacteriaceae bacterium]
MKLVLNLIFLIVFGVGFSQNNTSYWQQKADYKIAIDLDVETHQYKGIQELTYTNNSPDTLYRVFYHLYFNAFQPGSEMDIRSRNIKDSDKRVGDRISKLLPSEIGFIKPQRLTQDGVLLSFEIAGTILEVDLNTPILPNKSTVFTMDWDAQIPVQIRRSGRNNAEGVAYSMTQWFPKIAEYDFEGWHATPYIAREFHSVWGDYDVRIKLDENYVIGGTGYLQNSDKKGLGKKTKGNTRTWHFKAPKVHDFAWAADKDFIHDTYTGANGVILNFYYKNDPEIIENWKQLQEKTAQLLVYFNKHVGDYPYKQYSVIQGGDGGMEYAMCTLITGKRKLGSLIGVTAHELAHTWFQFLLATNESKHEWMDEGFTSYISNLAMNEIMKEGKVNPNSNSYRGYNYIATSGKEQPQSTQADRYTTNTGYGVAAYSKGAVFLSQLEYVIGKDNLNKTLLRYYKEWAFKHPTPNDFIRVAEKVSGAELDWYLTDWTQTTNTIDYGIKNIVSEKEKTTITIERIGLMPMPIDIKVTYEDGATDNFYIPLQMMRTNKPNPQLSESWNVLPDWAWAYPNYSFVLKKDKKIKSVAIDASSLMADINLENNTYNLK